MCRYIVDHLVPDGKDHDLDMGECVILKEYNGQWDLVDWKSVRQFPYGAAPSPPR